MSYFIAGSTWSMRKGGLCPVFECKKCKSRALDEADMQPCFHCGHHHCIIKKLKGGMKKNG